MRSIILSLGIAMASVSLTSTSQAGEMMYGCATRPECGKICKLVCETKKLQAVGYGYKCESICIPSHSRPGCKNCDMTCCAGDKIEGCPPKIEFCWYDWFACGCAQPRTVKVLTKYQAEREVDSYHWEVVDASCCDCVTQDGRPAEANAIYKPAPAEAQLGDVLAVSEADWAELAPILRPTEVPAASVAASEATTQPSASSNNPSATPAGAASEKISIAERLQRIFRK
jgi:hypothetical protein